MELELVTTIIESALKCTQDNHQKSKYGYWTTYINPIESKLKDKIFESLDK